ncbi:MAG TPA: isocitrate dehydrogenase (NADP(+)) [candidate division Zixibacteria bacterium]|nr:isocitrate dehydrogenase (NADP(+)) [candidate division Zixibacteria bacterium]
MSAYEKITPPKDGEKITKDSKGNLVVPNNPIIPYIAGDGIGPEIMEAMRKVVDAAIEKAFGSKKKIIWFEIFAGEKAREIYAAEYTDEQLAKLDPAILRNLYLPKDSLKAILDYIVAIKGPLTTPIGGGFRSLNVAIRQYLDLYSCVRPAKHIKGVPAPVKEPEKVNMVIFRENIEDVYSGIEFEPESDDAKKLITFLNEEFGNSIIMESGIGIKPMSWANTSRLVRMAIKYAIDKGYEKVTLVHKGNIMKFTEGKFKEWGYKLAAEEFSNTVITEKEIFDKFDGKIPEGKIMINDRIADSMFQQILLRPDEYGVLALPNLNGDYISDALAAQVGGLGFAPGANIGDKAAVFEATHGTAPKHAGLNKVNPGSVIYSAIMMLEYMGWDKAGELINLAIEKAIAQNKVTYDLARQLGDIEPIGTSEFADAIIANL